jgi:ribosomal-protein-serine acetyltransferase
VSPLPVELGDDGVLRRYVMGDLEELFAAVDAERERLGEWMPWVERTRTVEDQRVWLERVVADEHSLDGSGIWVGGALAGGSGMWWDGFGILGEIGYWIASAYEGRGFVTRACRALIDIAFGELGLHRVVIRAGVENVRSRAIPERLGFTQEGILRGEGKGSRGFHDLVVYGLLEDEWPPR